MANHRAADHRGIEYISLNNPRRSVGEIESSRVADEGRDLVTFGDASFRQKAPRLSGGAEDHDPHDSTQAAHRRIWESCIGGIGISNGIPTPIAVSLHDSTLRR